MGMRSPNGRRGITAHLETSMVAGKLFLLQAAEDRDWGWLHLSPAPLWSLVVPITKQKRLMWIKPPQDPSILLRTHPTSLPPSFLASWHLLAGMLSLVWGWGWSPARCGLTAALGHRCPWVDGGWQPLLRSHVLAHAGTNTLPAGNEAE